MNLQQVQLIFLAQIAGCILDLQKYQVTSAISSPVAAFNPSKSKPRENTQLKTRFPLIWIDSNLRINLYTLNPRGAVFMQDILCLEIFGKKKRIWKALPKSSCEDEKQNYCSLLLSLCSSLHAVTGCKRYTRI